MQLPQLFPHGLCKYMFFYFWCSPTIEPGLNESQLQEYLMKDLMMCLWLNHFRSVQLVERPSSYWHSKCTRCYSNPQRANWLKTSQRDSDRSHHTVPERPKLWQGPYLFFSIFALLMEDYFLQSENNFEKEIFEIYFKPRVLEILANLSWRNILSNCLLYFACLSRGFLPCKNQQQTFLSFNFFAQGLLHLSILNDLNGDLLMNLESSSMANNDLRLLFGVF